MSIPRQGTASKKTVLYLMEYATPVYRRVRNNMKKGDNAIMVDHKAKTNARVRETLVKSRLSTLQAHSIESVMARSYTDDVDMRLGALSAPRNHFRPGQRDDEVHCTFVSILPSV